MYYITIFSYFIILCVGIYKRVGSNPLRNIAGPGAKSPTLPYPTLPCPALT